jgi:ABC-2 type transport system ATP-binding protein
MTDRPHLFRIRSSDDRKLAATLMLDSSAGGVTLRPEGLEVQAVEFRRFARLLPQVARAESIRLHEVSPADEDLESVFSYLINRSA